MKCTVTVEGALAGCKVVQETPPALGYGQAALALSPVFLFTPAKRNGLAVAAPVTIPIKFELFEGGGGDQVSLPPGDRVRLATWAPWSGAPRSEDLAEAYPKSLGSTGPAGQVAMRCPLKPSGALGRCEITAEQPTGKGFGRAALGLAPKFRAIIGEATAKAVRAGDILVNVAVHFRAPGDASPRYLAQVDWLRAIDPEKAVQLFPDKAVAAKVVQGRGVVDCMVQPTGDLGQCQVVGETPAGLGFGESAALIAVAMRANLWTQDGQPTPGAHIKLPIRLDYKPPRAPEPAKP